MRGREKAILVLCEIFKFSNYGPSCFIFYKKLFFLCFFGWLVFFVLWGRAPTSRLKISWLKFHNGTVWMFLVPILRDLVGWLFDWRIGLTYRLGNCQRIYMEDVLTNVWMSAQTGQMDSFNCERVCSLGINAYFLLYFLSVLYLDYLFVRWFKWLQLSNGFIPNSKQALCPRGTAKVILERKKITVFWLVQIKMYKFVFVFCCIEKGKFLFCIISFLIIFLSLFS